MRAAVLALARWVTKPAACWQFWLPQSGITGGAVIGVAIITATLLLTGCSVVPASTSHSACELLQTASDEGDLAPAWYLQAGEVLERCGKPGAKAEAAVKACFASARNGYRDRKECEAME